MRDPAGPRDLMREGVLDAELGALLWLLLEARVPLVVVGPAAGGPAGGVRERVIDGLAGFLPEDGRVVDVAPDDDFGWLPEAIELGWRAERPVVALAAEGPQARRISSSDGVLAVRGLGARGGVTGERARIVVRALALGYGLLATMDGDGLDAAFGALLDPSVGADEAERSRLGVVIAVAPGGPGGPGGPAAGVGARIMAAHYVRPVALDTHGHVQHQAPAVLATWNEAGQRFDHFAWGVVPDLAGRLGLRPIDLEREQVRRITTLAALAGDRA